MVQKLALLLEAKREVGIVEKKPPHWNDILMSASGRASPSGTKSTGGKLKLDKIDF